MKVKGVTNLEPGKCTLTPLNIHLDTIMLSNLLVSKLMVAIYLVQVREVMAVCLSQPLVEAEEYQEAEKGIRNMAREELLTILQNVLDVLNSKGISEVLYILS